MTWFAVPGTEDEVVVLPGLPRRPQSSGGLLGVVLIQRPCHLVGDLKCPTGLLGLGVAASADGPPYVDRKFVVVEARVSD